MAKKRKIKHTKRGWRQDQKRRSKQPWEKAYQKKKKTKVKVKKRKRKRSSQQKSIFDWW